MRVSDNGRYLLEDTGIPFFYLADTAWFLFSRPNREEIVHYFDKRKEQGFSVIMGVLISESGTFKLENLVNAYGERPLVNLDPTQPNEKFFEHVDFVIRAASERGIRIGILPTWGEYVGPKAWGPGPEIFDEHSARVYGEFLGARYGEYRPIWVLGGDRRPENEHYLNIWRSMAAGIRKSDNHANLMTYHPAPGPPGDRTFTSSVYVHNEPWLDFNMIQTGTLWDLDNYNIVQRDYNLIPIKPTLDGETRYENSHEHFGADPPYGRRITAHQVRKAAYNSMLAGSCGHTYGCRDVYSFYDPEVGRWVRDVSLHWKDALDLPGAVHMTFLRKLFEDYPWYQLVPNFGPEGPEPEQQGYATLRIVAAGCGKGATFTPAALSTNRRFGLVYVPETQPVYINTDVLRNPSRARVCWFNPRSGEYTEQTFVGGGVQKFIPPTNDIDPDYVLVLDEK